MRASVASLSRKVVAALMAASLTFSMVPLAWADDGPTGTVAGTVAGNAAEGSESPEDAAGTEGTDAPAPEAEVQPADAKAAASTGDAATGTTIKIAVYRSSYPLVWDLNDAGAPDATKAKWDNKPEKWPTEGSPGSAVGTCEGYVAWTDDKNPGSEPSRTGFNFLGWSTKPTAAVEGTGKLDTLSIPKDTQPAEGEDGAKSITLYALWAPINYSVAFDLTKNPEDASAIPSFNWTTGKGTFSDLGGGRYRLSGVTLEDYDPTTGLIEIATPSRGTGGYRFLSWAEPDSQQDPTVAIKKSGSSKWYVNPVALPHYDYEPVLTARWSLSFDVDVPSQVTFDEYDSLEVEGNLTDTTDEDAIDEESADAHDAGKRAHFCSQSTATDYKIVALRSVRQETASKILTTSDSSKATQEEVLGSERLLSLFAEGATAESQGVHFKLDDAVDMDDSTRYGSFVIPKQQAPFDPTATERDDEERLYVSYRLNLSNKVGDSETPNHGLVTPGGVNEGDRTPIAEVSYEFAVADDSISTTTSPVALLPDWDKSSLFIEIPQDFLNSHNLVGTARAGVFGIKAIKAAAVDLAAHASNPSESRYYALYSALLASQGRTASGVPQSGPFFYLPLDDDVAPGNRGKTPDGYYAVELLGICQDAAVAGGVAGLTFGFKDAYSHRSMKDTVIPDEYPPNAGGWEQADLRTWLGSTFYGYLDDQMKACIVSVRKRHQQEGGSAAIQSTEDSIFIPSMYEVYGLGMEAVVYGSPMKLNINEGGSGFFQYQQFARGGAQAKNLSAIRVEGGSSIQWWFTRSASFGVDRGFCVVDIGKGDGAPGWVWSNHGDGGVLPCFAF